MTNSVWPNTKPWRHLSVGIFSDSTYCNEINKSSKALIGQTNRRFYVFTATFIKISFESFNAMRTSILLLLSNLFMTTAWYWHLKYKETSLWKVIIISWLIAFLEYCIAVPANRIGSYEFNAFELKTIQEVVSLTVFVGFAVLYLKEEIRWNYLVGFAFIVLAVFFIFKKW